MTETVELKQTLLNVSSNVRETKKLAAEVFSVKHPSYYIVVE